jgi:CheY-like chemotaxis protein/HPt (histidine-containing phosphotransfer) domain-containing protein
MLNLLEPTQLDNAQRHKLDVARTSATALLTLINDILDFSKIDAGKLDLDVVDFDLRQLLQHFVELMEPRAAEKKLHLVLDMAGIINPMVRGDPGRLRQIFMNLVGNAIKFTEHGEILVRCHLERNADGVVLNASVSDTGIGIPSHKLDALFTAFTQVDASTTRQYGGTGLGLAICKRLCNLMGGEIRADSMLGQGSEFSFSVNLQTASSSHIAPVVEHLAPPPAPMPVTWPADIRLLLVEDNAINREVARMMLEDMGLGIDIAGNGLQALTLLQAATGADAYTLILMDCQMPELDGYDTSRLIRAGSAGIHNKAITIVAMTANAMKGDREKCLAAGMNDYLSKPIDPHELANTLRQWLLPATRPRPNAADSGNHKPAHVAPALLAELVWDEQEMLASLSGRQERVNTLLKMYCNGLPERLETIDHALKEKNARQMNIVAHTIKGTAAQLRAQQLRKTAAALEIAAQDLPAKTTDWNQIELLVQQLISDSSQLADKFARHLGQG